MDYQFTMTPRLIAIAVISFISLLCLLFALGFQFGHQSGADEARQQAAATAPSQLNLPLPLTAFPASPTLGTPVSPMTMAAPAPALAPAAAAMASPAITPTGTLSRPN
jgi:hypothetical protein